MSCETVYISEQLQIGDLQTRFAVIRYQDKYRCVRTSNEAIDIVCEGDRQEVVGAYHLLQKWGQSL